MTVYEEQTLAFFLKYVPLALFIYRKNGSFSVPNNTYDNQLENNKKWFLAKVIML
jgi:hypothetical protein